MAGSGGLAPERSEDEIGQAVRPSGGSLPTRVTGWRKERTATQPHVRQAVRNEGSPRQLVALPAGEAELCSPTPSAGQPLIQRHCGACGAEGVWVCRQLVQCQHEYREW